MRRKTKLKPQIIRHLDEKGKTHFDLLVNQLSKETGVSTEKVRFRIRKMVFEGELLVKNGIVSRIFSSKISTDQEFDEIYKLGPITLGRKGNIVTIRSEYEKKDVEEIRREAKKCLPLARKDIEEGLKEIARARAR